MYIAPVFTGLEYVVVRAVRRRRAAGAAGVGADRVRLGAAAGVGVAPARRAAQPASIAGALLATNYVYVMWNRAALMEASMVAFMVARWYCYVRAQTQRALGLARPRPARCSPSSPRRRRRSSSRRSARGADRAGSILTGGETTPRRAARASSTLVGARRLRRCSRCVALRAAELGRLPLLQLADVGHAQAELRPAGR